MTDARCQQCGEPVPAGALFCSKCGVDVSSVMPAMEDTLPLTALGHEPVAPVRSTLRQALREATLGEYEILNELGRGGMATVFLAHDISLDRKVAIKVMAPHLLEGEGMAERFKLEARTAAQLSHPHIIPIYAVKETADTLFFVMKYIEGRALDDIIRKSGQLPIDTVRDVLIKVGSALGYAHRRDVVHRDIKPANVMIDDEGTPIVTDFGIAKVAETSGLTETGTTIGTPSYMSPEQCEAKEVKGASDQYSLGIVAFEMLTGKLPFEGDSAVSTMYKQCHEPLPPLLDFRPDCPPEVVETVTRMLAKAPGDRWPTMEAAVQRLSAGSAAGLDAARSQLVALARETGSDELVARLSDPSLDATVPVSTGGRSAAAIPSEWRSRALLALAVVTLVGAGALAVLRPWSGAASEAGGSDGVESAAVPGAGPGEQPAVDAGTPTDEGAAGAGDVDEGAPASSGQPPATDGTPPADGGSTSGDEQPAEGGASDAPDDAGPGDIDPGQAQRQFVVTSVTVSGVPGGFEPGDTAPIEAVAREENGGVVPASVIDACREHGWTRCGVEWSSSNASVARVSTGTVTAVAPGVTTISAVIAGVSGAIEVVVSEASVSEVLVEPDRLSLEQGQAGDLVVTLLGRDGSTLTGRTVEWRSSSPTVARVQDGTVQAVGPGTATITASAGGVEASLAVDVTPDARGAADQLIADFEAAFESGDLDRLSAVVPVGQDYAEGYEATFANAESLDAEFTVAGVEQRGDAAVATVSGVYRWVDRQAGRQEVPVTLTFDMSRTAGQWRFTSMR